MAEKYLSVQGECTTQKIIEKSRFITTSAHVCGEEEARAFIEKIRKKYPDATHNCYAYICDNVGNFLRFSDDGEPQGTAGMPMLEVIKANKIYEICVVVTRYFGGIKLGAGGLLRAYSGCVSENLSAASKVLYETCSLLKCTVGYSFVDAILRFIGESGADLIESEYKDEVDITVAVKKSGEESFTGNLNNRLNGRVKIQKLREYFFPFRV